MTPPKSPPAEPTDEEIDTSEIPELPDDFFEKASLVRPGESLIDTLRRLREGDS